MFGQRSVFVSLKLSVRMLLMSRKNSFIAKVSGSLPTSDGP